MSERSTDLATAGLRALTLWRPWPWAIFHAGKRIENRSWLPPRALIGWPIALHAGRTFDASDTWSWPGPDCDQDPSAHPTGIVGVARLVGVVREAGPGSDDPWFSGPIGWRLDDVLELDDAIPCKGAMGLWTVPSDLAARALAPWLALHVLPNGAEGLEHLVRELQKGGLP